MKILLFGVGMQGKAALHDLVMSEDVHEIIAADRDIDNLTTYVESKGYGSKVHCEYIDVGNQEDIHQLMIRKPDVVIDLLPADFINTIATLCVKNGIHLVNTFFITDTKRELANEAKAKGLILLTEFGLDPGIDLILFSEAARSMDTIESINCYGAGIPEIRFVS